MEYHYLVNVLTRRPMGLQNSLMKSFIEHRQKAILKKTSNFGQFELYGAYCSHKQLVSYVWAVCRSIVPVDFLGGTSNWRTFRKNISKFVRLRRFENFSLKQCTYGLKTSRFSFLAKISQSSCFCNHGIEDDFGEGASKKSAISDAIIILKDRLFLSWIHWFYSYLVVPLLGAHFYVTESEVGKQEISHYKKPLWRKVVNRAIICLRKRNYQILDHTSVQSILNKRPFGFSKVRFLPKEKGVRPLANLKAQSRARFPVHSISLNACNGQTGKRAEKFCTLQYAYKKPRLIHFRSVNYALHDLYVILKKIMGEQPEKLGSSVFDYNDAYKLLHPFITSLRIGSMVMPKVYIVVCDVSKAFDTIDQDKLLCVMRDIMHDDNYLLKKYAKVFCSKKSIRILYDQVPFDQNSSTDMIKATSSLQFHAPNGVLIDQGTSKRIKGKVFDILLSEHVKQNVVQLGNDFYLQKVGIAQGSLISSFLCSFYYGHLERSIIFPFIEKTEEHVQFESCGVEGNQYVENPRDCADEQGGVISHGNQYKDNGSVLTSNDGFKNASLFPKYVLLRLIDDFLFISTSKKQAASFLARMRRGFREYNCYMNEGKFGMNFDMESQSGSLSNRVYISEDGTLFLSWSGLLINCCTMEIQADYTRYLGIGISSTLTVPAQSKSCYHLKKKLCDYMRPKCHPIFYDSNINSPAVVRLNAYQSFLLCAMKFHCYICAMPDTSGISTQYYLEILQWSFRYMYKLIKKRMYSMKVGSNIHPILRLKREEVEWLGLSAYIRVLRRKQSRHAKLLLLLRSKSETYGREIHDSSHTRYAIDDSHSSMFWKMKY
ncbi:Telomerase reverse transcriptase [Acorus calamus]|uniref:Telomerase reverse transcriptase n=1 Tax=Acorus calamus TaxID=4465 RepID=A0AAV9EH79_ACOCL|nr:Telomerase reverse transcriptase [Acorus calamus]